VRLWEGGRRQEFDRLLVTGAGSSKMNRDEGTGSDHGGGRGDDHGVLGVHLARLGSDQHQGEQQRNAGQERRMPDRPSTLRARSRTARARCREARWGVPSLLTI